MKVLVACEFSGIVREAFKAEGHDAWSCDLLPTEIQGNHLQGDAIQYVYDVIRKWDLMIAHPPCTHLAVSGARWFKFKDKSLQKNALQFVMDLMSAPIDKVAIENPISIISSRIRKPDQIIQPYMFGHGETKATCLWLKNLPPLIPTHINDDLFAEPEPEERAARIHKMPPSENRWKERSRTFAGIAKAMAEQWGGA